MSPQRRLLLTLNPAFAAVLLTVVCAGCTDLKLARYRDDRLLSEYRYRLGEKYVRANGIRVCYQDEGSGDAVLILPGLGTTAFGVFLKEATQVFGTCLAEVDRVVEAAQAGELASGVDASATEGAAPTFTQLVDDDPFGMHRPRKLLGRLSSSRDES